MNFRIHSWPNLYKSLLETPYQTGYRELTAVTAFASSAFLNHVSYQFPDVTIDLIIGMSLLHPITLWDHNEYVRLSKSRGRCSVRYYVGHPPIHSKLVLWTASDKADKAPIGFVGSANFTWHGFRDYREHMAETASEQLAQEIAAIEADTVDCLQSDVFEKVPVSYKTPEHQFLVDSSALGAIAASKPFVFLPLTDGKGQCVPARSGLNWGQRPGREPNQAYIPIPGLIHRLNPDFFPPRKQEFTIITDDGFSFVCVVAQDKDKAIETRYDNSILGRYFRKRLGVKMGNPVSINDLIRYGRQNVTIYRLDDETYFLDFHKSK